MRAFTVMLLVAAWLCVLCYGGFAAMQDGTKLEADGKTIDIRIGHLVPCVTDWNNDGKKDLIIGQFSEGKIRVYMNGGTDSAPVFAEFSYLQADGRPIRLEAG